MEKHIANSDEGQRLPTFDKIVRLNGEGLDEAKEEKKRCMPASANAAKLRSTAGPQMTTTFHHNRLSSYIFSHILNATMHG